MRSLEAHHKKVTAIARQIKKYDTRSHKKLRFFHGSSNSTRDSNNDAYYWIDISRLNNVIEVNVKENYVLTEPNVPMDKLVQETLKYGRIPQVVMEFPGITVGGGINGAALESSSFRYGQFNDTAIEYEMILGNGEIITASSQKNQDIFYGVSGSYGSLGLISLVKIRLQKAAPYVLVHHEVTGDYQETLAKMRSRLNDNDIDFLEGIVFSPNCSVIITGKLTDEKNLPLQTYSKATDPWFYERAKTIAATGKESKELVPITEFLFRYNRGAFWVGEFVFPYLNIPNTKLSHYLMNPLMNTRKLFDGVHALNMGQDWFVQDFYVPWDKTQQLLTYSEKSVDIWPIWLCPVKQTNTPQKLSPHFLATDDMIMDVGIWGQTDKYTSDPIGKNQEFETELKRIHGRKMLYAHQYYTEDTFWKIYDASWYKKLREKYHALIFPDVWAKTHVRERYKIKKWRGILKVFAETIRGKNVNA